MKVSSGHGVWVMGCPSTNKGYIQSHRSDGQGNELSLRFVKLEMPVG